MRTRKQKIILAAKIIATIFLVIIIALFAFRNALLKQAIAKISFKMERDYNSVFSIKEASFVGFSGVSLSQIILVPKDADTLFNIQKMKTSVNFWRLLIGDIQLGTLEIENGYVQLVKNKKGRNFEAFLKKDEATTNSNEKRNYAKFAYRIISKVLNLVPTDMKIENLSFRLNDDGNKTTVNFQKLRLVNQQLETYIKVETNTFTQRIRIRGFADPRNKKADIRFFNMDSGAIKMPYIDERFNLKSSFDSIRVNIENIDKSGGKLHIDGFASIANLMVNHPKIASKDVVIKNAKFDFRFLLGSDFISIDSSSTVEFNKIKFHPYLSYETREDTIYKLKVAIPKMKAQDFISSLPDGLFSHFQGMEAEGNFEYNLDFMFNKNKPNTLIFDSNLKKENLKITKYGEANLNKLNGEFVYRAIINNVPQRPVLIGSSNPNYTPLDQISPYLQKCVLTSEDPSFFSHRGFINEAFKQSILKNIRTKKFSRGASTISMQLIKNVFLTREKTASRKLEEILLVYILENNRIASKERMLEVYFNIIEWGPNVYGIGEASQFYFQKRPADLTLKECLFLATIVPKPKKFMWQFDNEGKLKSFANQQQKFLSNLMLRRGILIPEDTIGQSIPLNLSGNAHSLLKLKVQDSIPVDSLAVEEPYEF
ncbi:transglycosylase domain-containing protein [Flavobacterium soyangense]|uniref:Transglycosylase domain-containing protein n=1 Tax=Flavobacterium soyangense TaxID=2023265 RepID=A0A930U944_9FLAO|nr:biosynthetic peptidoglycan transglycosylase [Flavobacterium soyangense]MBF2707139.1 transglycosylase domain-containing protein [Flavobacterium soyangense]